MAKKKFMNVYINDFYLLGGPLEKKGLLKNLNITMDDYYFGEKTFEKAEVKMQKTVLDNLLKKNKLKDTDIECLVGGELSNQIATTNYNMKEYNIPFLGVYSACATFVETLIILANLIDSNMISKGIALTSSHNLTSEKQFRFPIEYGAPKPDCTTFTATGSVGSIVSNTKGKLKIESVTIGSVVDGDIKDPFNLGAAMAPSAAEVLVKHLSEMKRKPDYYDVILTGDLGNVGSTIFKEFLKLEYNIELKNHVDAACEIYTSEQKTFSGASGPTALPLTLFSKIIHEPKYKKILIIGTGALHSPVMVNQKNSIPGVSHLISLEVL